MMNQPTFNDAEGRTWRLRLTTGRSREILETTGIDFGKIHDGQVFCDLTTSDEKLAQVLWILCEKQAGSVTPEEFAESLDGNALDSAMEALVEATILFTRAPIRGAVEKVIRKTMEAQSQAMKTVENWVETNSATMIAQVTQAAETALTSGA
jgi:tRNA A-37 threonylcarbamoyl transferase component Bud32